MHGHSTRPSYLDTDGRWVICYPSGQQYHHFHTTSINSFSQHSITFSPFDFSELCSTPLHSTPHHSTSFYSSPLHSISLHSFSFHCTALHAIPLPPSFCFTPFYTFLYLSTKLYNVLSTMFRSWRCKVE